MGQLTIYLPDDVEAALRREAKRTRKSVSALVVEKVSPPVHPNDYQAALDRLYGSWKGELPEPPELPLRKVPSLD
jgi:hypothetical protein